MAIDNNSLCYLFDSIFQVENVAGRPVVGGHIEVFIAGTDQKYITWQNFDGTKNPFKIPLNNDGRAVILVEPHYTYDIYIYDSFNNMICSRLNVKPAIGGDVTVYGLTEVWHDSTMSGEGTPQSPLSVVSAGKVYDGVEPIVVNNIENKISANHVPLGVQDPLYFVQDDEEGCIIGFSGETIPEGTMNESAFGYEDGQITSYNGSAFSAGNTYEAGSYVDIDGNTINVTGLQPAGNYQSAGDYVVHDELSSYATEEWVENQSYMKEYMESAFYPSTSNPSGYLTAHQDISDKLDATAFSTVSGDFLTAIPSEYVTENTLQSGLSSKLDSTAFSTVSGDFLTAHQSLDGLMSASLLEQSGGLITGYNGTAFAGQGGGVTGDYLTKESADTLYQPIGNYQTAGNYQEALTFNYTNDDEISGINGSAIAGGQGLTGDYELSAGSGISIVDYPLEQKTVISVTAQGGNPEVEQAVIDNSATWNEVSSKLDTTAFSDVSGTFLTAHQDLSDYQTIAGMTAYQPVGNYLTADALDELSGNWETVTAKQDALSFEYNDTAISAIDNSALYDYSAHARINTLAGRISDLSSNKLDTTAFSDVSGSFLTAVPGTYLQNTDLTLVDNKITEISGIPLSAGDELPEGLMNTSALEYNAVNEISGYNGSAIAQYGAEKQWLTHDDTIVHVSNSAQYALGVNLPNISADLARMMGVDETVLWTNPNPSMITTGTTLTAQLSEPISAFKQIRFDVKASYDYNESIVASRKYVDFIVDDTAKNEISLWLANPRGTTVYIDACLMYLQNNMFTAFSGIRIQRTYPALTGGNDNTTRGPYIYGIYGIGRKN